MLDKIIEEQFAGSSRRIKMAKDGCEIAKQWIVDNKGSDDKVACEDYVKKELKQKYGSVIIGIVLSFLVNLIVKLIIDRLFTEMRDEYFGMEGSDIEVSEEQETEIWETEGGLPRFE